MRTRLFIDGDQGTTGLQILQRLGPLQQRFDLQVLTLPEARRKDPATRADALAHCDIAMLCLPDAAARESVILLGSGAARVIDASSAHRTQPGWVYGFAELAPDQAGRIAKATRVTNPGCYPTGALALLRPLRDAGLVEADCPLVIHAISGYSGGGRERVQAYETAPAAPRPGVQLYGLSLEHKHVPEIQHHARLTQRPIFVPAYGNFRQGIVLTIPLHLRLLAPGATGQRLHDALQAHYNGCRNVRVMPLAETAALAAIDPEALNGSDDMQLMVFDNPRQQQVLLAAVFDNLGKGAAGAAVQNLALMLGGP